MFKFFKNREKNDEKITEAEKPALSNSEKLNNVKNGAKVILPSGYKDRYDLHPIFSYIKIFTDKTVYTNAAETAAVPEKSTVSKFCKSLYIDFNHMIFPYETFKKQGIFIDKLKFALKGEVSINLSDCPILPMPWDKDRLVSAISTIGGESSEWKQSYEFDGHQLTLWYPIGVCFVDSGNHSIFSGKLKSDGVIKLSPGMSPPPLILDLRLLYNIMYFDGDCYRRVDDDTEIASAESFEFGCVFEIGRLILKCGIYFKGIKI